MAQSLAEACDAEAMWDGGSDLMDGAEHGGGVAVMTHKAFFFVSEDAPSGLVEELQPGFGGFPDKRSGFRAGLKKVAEGSFDEPSGDQACSRGGCTTPLGQGVCGVWQPLGEAAMENPTVGAAVWGGGIGHMPMDAGEGSSSDPNHLGS